MTPFLVVVALLGLLIFVVGGILFLLNKAPGTTLMVVGGIIYAIAQVIVLFDSLF